MGIRGSAKGGHVIQDEGVDLPDQEKLDFVGAGVTVTDDSGKTKVDIPSGGGGTTTKTIRVPLRLIISEGVIAYTDVPVFATQVSKTDGFVLPDGASVSIFNFKGVVPDDLASTQNASVKFYIYTLGAVVAKDVRLTLKSIAIADGEDGDIAFTAETEQTVRMPDTTESLDIYDQALTDTLVAGDEFSGQLSRDPTDALDNFTDDIIVIKAFLEIDVTR